MRPILEENAKANFVDSVLPDALRLVASNLRSGLTVDWALLQSAREEFGSLKDAIEIAGKGIATGKSEEAAFSGMPKGIKSENLSRAVDLMVQGIRSGGQLANILDKIADIFRNRSLLSKEMRSSVLMYAIFIFFIIGLAAPVLFAISDYLVSVMSGGMGAPQVDISQEMVIIGAPLMQSKSAGVDPKFMTTYFLAALIVSSLTGSIVLGQILSGNEKAGFKFIPILLALSIVLFSALKYLLALVLGSMIGK